MSHIDVQEVGQTTPEKKQAWHITTAALVASNCVPIVGVLFFGWDVGALMVLFWFENVIIGFINVLRMLSVAVPHPAMHLGKLFMIPFFIFHYGMFTAIHGIFVVSIFVDGFGSGMSGMPSPGGGLFDMLYSGLAVGLEQGLGWAMAALFVSHFVSFVVNFFMMGERNRVQLDALMGQPYSRVVMLHVTIIFGGMFAMMTKSNIFALLVLIAIKTAVDVKQHQREHRKLGEKEITISNSHT